jgi:Amt family ammonium transporter
MINLIKKILLSIVILFSITGLASAETTISAEGQYIFNTLGFLFRWCISCIYGCRILYA